LVRFCRTQERIATTSNLKCHQGLRDTFDEEWRQPARKGDAEAVKGFLAAVMQRLCAFCLYRVGRDRQQARTDLRNGRREKALKVFSDL
jgi:hypothetical protein